MRARTLTLLLILLALVAVGHDRVETAVVATAAATGLTEGVATRHDHWRFDRDSRYFDVLPEDVQSMRSTQPAKVADAVCSALGGTVHVLQSAHADRESLAFNCLFEEPGLPMSVEFGELRRTTATP